MTERHLELTSYVKNKWTNAKTVFVSTALTMALIASSGCESSAPQFEPTMPAKLLPTKQEQTKKVVIEKPVLSSDSRELFSLETNEVIFLMKGLVPVKYFAPNEYPVLLDEKKMTELREEAIKYRKRVIIDFVLNNIKPSPYSFTPSKEKPRITELPNDVVSDEELAQRGIKIDQNEELKLYIRNVAFQPGGILESYPVSDNPKKKLSIVLINKPTLLTKDLKNDDRCNLEEVEKKLSFEKFENKEDLLLFIKEKLRNKLQAWGMGRSIPENLLKPEQKQEIEKLKSEVYRLEVDMEILKNNLSPEQLETMAIEQQSKDRVGNVIGAFCGNSRKDEAIYLALGEGFEIKGKVISFNERGNIEVLDHVISSPNFVPKPHNISPNPQKEYSRNPSPEVDYPVYSNNNPSHTIFHEIVHSQGISDENETDLMAEKIEQEIYNDWEGSGFTENKGPFVFAVPKKFGGGWIIIEKEQTGYYALYRISPPVPGIA